MVVEAALRRIDLGVARGRRVQLLVPGVGDRLALPLLALRSRDRRKIVAGALVLVGLALQTALLSVWWTPFGWFAWGPRLIMPTLAMAVVAVVALFHGELLTAFGWLRQHPWSIALLAGLTLISASANLGFLTDPGGTLQWFFEPHATDCTHLPDLFVNPKLWFHCYHGVMTWRIPGSLWVDGARHIYSLEGILLVVSALIALLALLDLERARPAPSPSPTG